MYVHIIYISINIIKCRYNLYIHISSVYLTQINGWLDIYIYRQKDKQIDRLDSQLACKKDIQRDRYIDGQIDIQIDRYLDRQIERQIERYRQIDK